MKRVVHVVAVLLAMLIAFVAGFALAIARSGQSASISRVIRPTPEPTDAETQRHLEDVIRAVRAQTFVDGRGIGEFDIAVVRAGTRVTILDGDPSRRFGEVSIKRVSADEVRGSALSRDGTCFGLRRLGGPDEPEGQRGYASRESGECSPMSFSDSDYTTERWVTR